ncbi:uncharacterized protein TRUGW13939_00579 [Talaromyces rugulosus]|uniref:Transcription factor domain-containing protein n=1 Tax=Talaromyces rugulosus TaxID=121627 RepID=A0A7H8QHX0_TALRU|nr:uncharacterized protein TRUGW13939_00579 [Talaromyces rugulosus]QKX53500.1 hypothetical protein TRUGW13939_00579 [Talaromyces rugulosus]
MSRIASYGITRSFQPIHAAHHPRHPQHAKHVVERKTELHLASITEKLVTLEKTVHQLSSIVKHRQHAITDRDESVFDQTANPRQLRESTAVVQSRFYSNRKPPLHFDISREEHDPDSQHQPVTPQSTRNKPTPHASTSKEVPTGLDQSTFPGKESNDCNEDHGLTDFHAAISILHRLQFDFTLEFAQAEMLAGIYLYRKSRILDAWRHMNAGCTALYVMTKRDLRGQTQRDRTEWNTILRLYWVSLNLENDILVYHPDLPRSPLYKLEESVALPLGCEESATTHMPASVRKTYTFFLAETGLKAILKRMPSVGRDNGPVTDISPDQGQTTLTTAAVPSAVNKELESQLSTWLAGVPSFLGWSPEPCLGEQTKVGTRLKLLYWFARFSLYSDSTENALHNSSVCFTMQAWTAVQDTLLAAQNLVQIFVSEKSDPDPILQHRVRLVMSTLESAMVKNFIQSRYTQEVGRLLQMASEMVGNNYTITASPRG